MDQQLSHLRTAALAEIAASTDEAAEMSRKSAVASTK